MIHRNLFILILLVCNLPALTWATDQNCRLPESSLLGPPVSGKPVIVKISNFILDIESVDDQKQQFTSDFIVDFIWNDPRLGQIATNAQGPCRFNPDTVWNPEIQLFNIRQVTARMPNFIKVEADGTVTYTQRYYGTLASPLNLHEFPFDQQSLAFTFVSLFDSTQVVLENNPALSGQDSSFSIAGWNNAVIKK